MKIKTFNHRASAPRTVVNHLFGKLEKSTYRQDTEKLHRGDLLLTFTRKQHTQVVAISNRQTL